MRTKGLAALLVVFCFFVSLAAITLSPTPANAKPIVLKCAHQNPPKGSTTVRLIDPFMKKIEEATKGKVKIVSYPAQSLAKAKEMVTAIEGGIADMSWAPLGYYPGRFPLSTVILLPFIALSSAEKNSMVLQELFETTPELQKEFSSVKVLFFHTSSPYFLATSKKPVRNLNDVKGLKLRIMGTPAIKASKLLGISPLFMPMPGVYEAGEKGVLDGAALPWAAVATFNLFEVFNYWTEVDLWIAHFVYMMNKDKWNSLPPDIQKAITSVSGMKAAGWGGKSAFGPQIQGATLDKVKKGGQKFEKIALDSGEFERWRKAAGEPVWNEWVKEMEKKGLPGRKVLDKTLRLMKKYK
ncbi:MAG: TRAP transporter substrate-binding protein [Deltaproteobacteria bacterium]|nr:TRAP transporter substrate-binding protein [Deltaproteobacteria bacterium]